ncbi:GNAT family N-acetyltransferase [Streptomyces sp. NPDC058045]|uniref:GNAT family N-acetyltransferase n=1 Tax=Streptomyces sp. NPDC058045 TaxID=3346311 RepID=UPI0036E0FA97
MSTTVAVRPALETDRATVDRLWLMFRHDLSEFDGGALPRPDGSYRDEWVHAAFAETDRAPYLLALGNASLGEHPVGFAFVRGLHGPVRVLNSFFVVRGARRTGIGMAAVRQITARHPGPWEVAFQDANTGAARFWRRAATELTGGAPGAWTEEHRPVPGRPEIPPDTWISLTLP